MEKSISISELCYSFDTYESGGTYEFYIKNELKFLYNLKRKGCLCLDIHTPDKDIRRVFDKINTAKKITLRFHVFKYVIPLTKVNYLELKQNLPDDSVGLLSGYLSYIDESYNLLYEAVSFVEGIDNEHVFISTLLDKEVVEEKSKLEDTTYTLEDWG